MIRLYGATHDAAFRDAALEALAYEDSLYSQEHSNWPDLRGWSPDNQDEEFASSWCNGGTGIGLARLGARAVCDSDRLRHGIDAGIRVAQTTGMSGVDHLCCGNMGRADVLLEAGIQLGRPDLIDASMERTACCFDRAQEQGRYRLWWDVGGGLSLPGLFQGMSGIGYSLLRAAYPGELLCALMWA